MKTLEVKEERSVLKITLNKPDIRNAFSPEMIRELTDVFHQASKDDSLRAILLRGEGKVFCAGADLNYMREMAKFSFEDNQTDAGRLHRMFEEISACAVPVVCQVHGAAYGGALGLIAASDLVIGEQNSQYCFSEVKLGIAPAVISDFVLRKASLGAVAPWMLSGQVFTTADAIRMGLVHFSAPAEELSDLAEKTVQALRENGPKAVRETKKLIHKMGGLERAEAKAMACDLIAHLRAGEEGQEGLLAFLSKRTPSWRLT